MNIAPLRPTVNLRSNFFSVQNLIEEKQLRIKKLLWKIPIWPNNATAISVLDFFSSHFFFKVTQCLFIKTCNPTQLIMPKPKKMVSIYFLMKFVKVTLTAQSTHVLCSNSSVCVCYNRLRMKLKIPSLKLSEPYQTLN